MNADADLLIRLRSVLDAALESALPAEAPVALIGIPLWTNVGDHAIFLGTLRWLQRHGHEVAHSVADARDYSPSALRRALGPDGVIALAGGATVGDTWPERQRFRERVLAENGDVPIVQLPQSIHFDDPGAAARASEAFAAHPRFTLMARDADSEERARSLGCDPVLAPDIAFALDPLPRPAAPEVPVVSLIRRDRESALPTPQPPPDSVDWAAPDPLARRLPVQGAHVASRTVARSATMRRLALRRYTAYGEKRLEAGAAMLESRQGRDQRSHPRSHPLPAPGHSPRGPGQPLRQDVLVSAQLDRRVRPCPVGGGPGQGSLDGARRRRGLTPRTGPPGPAQPGLPLQAVRRETKIRSLARSPSRWRSASDAGARSAETSKPASTRRASKSRP